MRIARHEQLRLRRLKVSRTSTRRQDGNFSYSLTRSADDMPQPAHYVGKGAAWCFRGAPDEIFVWSMTDPRPPAG